MKKFIVPVCLFSTFFSLSAIAAPVVDNNTTVTVVVSADAQKKMGQVLELLRVINANEVTAGKIALQRASHADVKKFAEIMVDDHTQNIQDIKNLAQALQITLLPSEKSVSLENKGKEGAQKLESVPKRRFDKVYMNAMVEGHQKVLNTIDQDLLPNAVNPRVIDNLKATRAKVAMHLKMAKEIQSRL